MNRSALELFFGSPYTQRGSLGFGILMFVTGSALLFWRTDVQASQRALIMGSLVVVGGALLMIGPVCGWLNIQPFAECWNYIAGMGSVIAGGACLLFPVFQPTIFAIVVGLCAGAALIGQGISTVRVTRNLS